MFLKRLAVALFMLTPLLPGSALPAGVEATPAPHQVDPKAPPSVAILGTLDKITAKVTKIEVFQDKPFQLGTLEITLRTCHGSPPEETPEAAAFLEISESRNGQKPDHLFTGWMFASSPSLSGLDHPVYDVWVVSCKIASGAGSLSSK